MRKETSGPGAVVRILYTVVQLTWGCLQNILGTLLWITLVCVTPKRSITFYRCAVCTEWKFPFSMGLGMFIFLGHRGESVPRVLVHEYGHTIQSIMLGPLFLPVIGIPSLVWAFTPVFARMRREGRFSYSDFYPEGWADRCGQYVTDPSRHHSG